MFFSKDIVISEKTSRQAYVPSSEILNVEGIRPCKDVYEHSHKIHQDYIPFLKNNEFDYSMLISWIGKGYHKWDILYLFPSLFHNNCCINEQT